MHIRRGVLKSQSNPYLERPLCIRLETYSVAWVEEPVCMEGTTSSKSKSDKWTVGCGIDEDLKRLPLEDADSIVLVCEVDTSSGSSVALEFGYETPPDGKDTDVEGCALRKHQALSLGELKFVETEPVSVLP